MSKDIHDIVQVANSLSNDDLANLITILGDRLDVYVGQLGRYQISSPVKDACMNGAVVQINLELSDLDDISEAAEAPLDDAQAIYADFQGRMVRAGHDQAISVLDECFRDHLIDQNEEVRV